MKKTTPSIQRGQAITFRIPSDAPDHTLRQLRKLKETEKRNFSSTIAEYVMESVGRTTFQDQEMIAIPLPHKLSKSQRDWLKHAHSEALLGSIVYQLLTDPLRATALLASLNSNALDIDDALYLQEESVASAEQELSDEEDIQDQLKDPVLDLDDFDWGQMDQETESIEESEQEEDLDDLLGDFLAQMNK
ncbi:hypothetical protein [Bacillus cihuensis]|uniref:hypothetical protein n=1 Tax=Bacillus cihuensis TaxID=1208599 RepID=UPI0003F74D4A|nr:hypothetical protein [Bacillus cihuensis]